MTSHPNRISHQLIATIGLTLLCTVALAADDPTLQGCWRPQQTRLTFDDGSQADQRPDCVVEYKAGRGLSRCHGPQGDVETQLAYEVAAPGKLRVTPLDAATGKPKVAPLESTYQRTGDWMILTRELAPASASTGKRLVQSTTVAVRVDPAREGSGACNPRGDTGLRTGTNPSSSLAFKPPSGWAPKLMDPSADKRLLAAVGPGFLIGVFMPMSDSTSGRTSLRTVVVLDDLRAGAVPVVAKDFETVKSRFLAEVGAPALCTGEDHVCGRILQDGRTVFTELLNIRGRVAMINVVSDEKGPEVDAASKLIVEQFQAQLRRDNP